MAKLYEILAAEATVEKAETTLFAETLAKFQKGELFNGLVTNLTMIAETVEAQAIARDGSSVKVVSTSAMETLRYCLDIWANAENVRATKNATNQIAKADLIVNGVVLAANLPVDELMGLEARLKKIQGLLTQAPTLDASKTWTTSTRWSIPGLVEAPTVSSVKTNEVVYGIIMAQATDKHPAQVQAAKKAEVVGYFDRTTVSSAFTTDQKAAALAACDNLIVACRQARNRANAVDIVEVPAGTAVAAYLMNAISGA